MNPPPSASTPDPAPAMAAARPPDPRSADEAAIRSARATQTQALARGDLDAAARFWTPDVTIRRALGQAVDGAGAARQVLEPAPGADPAGAIVYQREAVSVEVSAHWPLAYEEGRWTGHRGAASGPALLGGRYSAQWVRRDGRWLIRAEVFVALTCVGEGCGFDALP